MYCSLALPLPYKQCKHVALPKPLLLVGGDDPAGKLHQPAAVEQKAVYTTQRGDSEIAPGVSLVVGTTSTSRSSNHSPG